MADGDDPDEEIRELREWMVERGLMSPIPPELMHDDARLDALIARVTGEPKAPAVVRRSRRARAVVLAAVAAVLVVVLVAVGRQLWSVQPVAAQDTPRMLTYSVPVDHFTTAPSAATVLLAAATAADGSGGGAHGGDVQYVAAYGWLLATDQTQSMLYPTTTERWLAADGSMVVVQHRASALNLDGTIRTGASPEATASTDTFPAGSVDPTVAARLPRDPATVGAALASALSLTGCQQTVGQCLALGIETLYASYVVPPDLAATLWRALADQSDAYWLGATTDRFGARVDAVAVQGGDASQVEVLLVSPTSGRLTGTETVSLNDHVLHLSTPTVIGFSSIRQSTWVNRVGAVPATSS